MKLRHIIVFVSGLIFSLGLGLAGMTQPAKVVDFLDFTGHWDASLAMVMVGAIAVHLLCYRLIRRRRAPVFEPGFSAPPAGRIDARLVVGAAVFGLGWGLAGYCPGSAFASLAAGGRVIVLVLGMLGGMALYELGVRVRRQAIASGAVRDEVRPSLEIEATQGS